jgi:hypothetical protein
MMSKNITEKIDQYLVGDSVNEMMLEPNETGIKQNEYNSISTGLKRIEFRLLKANTPQKYVDAFEVIQQLINRFPLKSKIIWQAISNIYNARFGVASAPADMPSGNAGVGAGSEEY